MTLLTTPHALYQLDELQLAHHSLERFKMIMRKPTGIPSDIVEKIEDEIIPALQFIVNWDPSETDIMMGNSCGTPWHDGLM